ncbi:hypothetical protein NQZ79_g6771 [Umbelopsis isabellina]|nr:hypothetical protein NQZ79_g6771 [Umbelopsis isabellina]
MAAAAQMCYPPCGPDATCLRNMESNLYGCYKLSPEVVWKFGAPRKCAVRHRDNCKETDQRVSDPSECCDGVAAVREDDKDERTCGLRCVQTNCDTTKGCSNNGDCQDYEECIDGTCEVPIPGVECGICGKPPINGRCCYEGVIDPSGKCFCPDNNGYCTKHIDCYGHGFVRNKCCGNKCCPRDKCIKGVCRIAIPQPILVDD